MNISDTGLALIKKQEDCVLTAYRDVGGVLTIGYGHTGSDVSDGLTWTQEQADSALATDIETVEKCINNLVAVTITQNQFDALCDFVFNLGCSALRNSTLLRKLNDGDDEGAAGQFGRWIHDDGKILPDLVARRNAEMELFQT